MRSPRWTTAQRRVLNALQYSDHPLSVSEIATNAGTNPNTVRNYLTRWRRNGLVQIDDSSVPLTVRLSQQFKATSALDDKPNTSPWDAGASLEEVEIGAAATQALSEHGARFDSLEDSIAQMRILLLERTEPLHLVGHAECSLVECKHCEQQLDRMLQAFLDDLRQAAHWAGVDNEFNHVMRAWSWWISKGKPSGQQDVLDTLLGPAFD